MTCKRNQILINIILHDGVAIKASAAHYCHTLQLHNHIALFIHFCEITVLLSIFFFFPDMGEAPEVFYINGFSKFEHEIETQQNHHVNDQNHDSSWYEEIIDEDLKWSFKLNRLVIIASAIHYSKSMYIGSNKKILSFSFCSASALLDRYNFYFCFITLMHFFYFYFFNFNSVLHKAISEYQDIALLDTKRFGKVCNLCFFFS